MNKLRWDEIVHIISMQTCFMSKDSEQKVGYHRLHDTPDKLN